MTTGAALILAAGFLTLFIGGGARFAVGLTLKPIVDDLGWGRGELGLAERGFQRFTALAVARLAFNEDGAHHAVAALGDIGGDLRGMVGRAIALPQMMVRIDDLKRRVERRLGAERQPFGADRQVRGGGGHRACPTGS